MATRDYQISDADMFQESRTVRLIFIDDKLDFVAVDPDLADPFADEWEDSIETSEGWETDETRTDLQKQETADVKNVMADARKAHAGLKFYVEKALAGKQDLMDSFGLNDYEAAANNQGKMVVYLKNAHKQCSVAANKALLLAAGMTQLNIDNLLTLYTALTTENQEQNKMIKTSPEASDKRVKQYNSTFNGFWVKVNKASKVVHYGNVIKLNQYALPHGNEKDFNVEGKVIDGSNEGANLKGVKVSIAVLGVVVFTNGFGNYGLVGVPPGIYTVQFELAGYVTQTAQITVTQDGKLTVNKVLVVG